jgi:hypothetical protein
MEQVADKRTVPGAPGLHSQDIELLVWAAAHGTLAPSKHNTQPWRFELFDDHLDVHLDGSRLLPASDPLGREAVISCGAAVANIRLALRASGATPHVTLIPYGDSSSCLASIRVGERSPLTDTEKPLYDAITERHTNRGSLDGAAVPPALVVALVRLATAEGAGLRLVQIPGEQRDLGDVTAAAARRADSNSALRAELLEWVRADGEETVDGVPATAAGLGAEGARQHVPTRNFDVTGAVGGVGAVLPKEPLWAILWTTGDTVGDWLLAGQAMQMMLLRATADGASASFANQAIEDGIARQVLRERLSLPGPAQVVLRLGVGAAVPSTPRRAPEDVIDVVDLTN